MGLTLIGDMKMSMVDIEMAAKFAQIDSMRDKNNIVYIHHCLQLDCGRLIHTWSWANHFGYTATGRLNYWKVIKD